MKTTEKFESLYKKLGLFNFHSVKARSLKSQKNIFECKQN